MRSFITLGVLSVLGAAAFMGCGDDDGDGTGVGGQAGSAANGGTGGAGGAGGSAGSANNGGAAGNPGGGAGGGGGAAVAPGPLATCTGCVELIVPVTGANSQANVQDQAIFQFNFPAPGVDFSNAVVTWRVQAVANNDNFFVRPFAGNGAHAAPDVRNYAGIFPQTPDIYRTLTAAGFPANTWVDITLDISAYASAPGGADAGVAAGDAGDAGTPLDPGNFDKSVVEALGIQVGTTGAFAGSGVVRVSVDTVTITGVTGQATRTFTTGVDGLAVNTYELPTLTPAPFHHP